MEKGVERVIITIGKRGVYYYDGETEEIIGNYNVKVLDTTGAGDAFNGGLLAGLSQGNGASFCSSIWKRGIESCGDEAGNGPCYANKARNRRFIEKRTD